MQKNLNQKLKLAVFLIFFLLIAGVTYFGLAGAVRINRQNYDYIKSMANEESVALHNAIDSGLKTIRGYADAKGEGLDISAYTEYMPLDRTFYVSNGSELALELQEMDLIKYGMQGKSGIEVDFAKILGDEVTLVFYAPVTRGGHVIGVFVGQLIQSTMQKLLWTDCYGTPARSALATSTGDIIFTGAGQEVYIGQNLFRDYFEGKQLISASLDNLSDEELTFKSLSGAMYNHGDFAFTSVNDGVYETTYVKSLDSGGLAVVETFPPEVSARMTGQQIKGAVIVDVILVLLMLFFVGPLVQKYARYRKVQYEAMKADAANSAKSAFLSKMSHDMRTPLNGILGMADIALRNSGDAEKTRDCLKKIKSSGHYLLSLINEVLDLNTIEAGRMDLVESEVNLVDLLEDVKILVGNLLAGKDLTFSVDNQLTHADVLADSTALEKIAVNLLSNAVKYTPAGGAISFTCRDEASSDPEYRWYYITVKDNGIGMSKAFMEKMFNPYEREADVRAAKLQGTGLGLSIVKALTEQMHGGISVESEEGKGSAFTVKLLLRPMTKKAETKSSEAALELDAVDCSAFRCLLVEDNELNIEIAKTLLSLSGITVETAVNGQEAVNIFADRPENYYDIIFMDIQMPLMDGYQAARKIRAMERPDAASVPIIAMTANAYDTDVKHALEAGMNEHIAKPIEQHKLTAALCKYLEVTPK